MQDYLWWTAVALHQVKLFACSLLLSDYFRETVTKKQTNKILLVFIFQSVNVTTCHDLYLGLPYSPALLDMSSFLVIIIQSGRIFEISENVWDSGLFVEKIYVAKEAAFF